MTKRLANWQGTKWCRREKRLAIYLRDGMACVYCGRGVEDGATLTLDHVRPDANGGTNEARNLVTACGTCNSARGTKPLARFCDAEAVKRVRRQVRRRIDTATARALIAERGGFVAAVASLVKG